MWQMCNGEASRRPFRDFRRVSHDAREFVIKNGSSLPPCWKMNLIGDKSARRIKSLREDGIQVNTTEKKLRVN